MTNNEATPSPLLSVRDLRVSFGAVEVLHGVDLNVRPGVIHALIGESGSGKSVLARSILGLAGRRSRTTGSIRFEGRELVGLTEKEYRAIRGAEIGMVVQDAMSALNPMRTIGEQLVETIRFRHPDYRTGRTPHEADLQSRPYPDEEFLNDWLVRTCEIVDRYQPSLLYFDWWIQHEAFREVLKTFTAYYYNQAAQWGKKAAVCYKHDAMMFGSGIVEVERGALADAKPYAWQTDTAIAKNSWCYTDTLEYKTAGQIIRMLIEVISKNGNMLLNVGPRGDGSIPEEDRKILKEIGEWMKVNGEAVYGSRPWRKSGEGPVRIHEGQFTDNEEPPYTSEDIRFTVRGGSIYAFVMRFPEDGRITIRSLGDSEDQNTSEFHGLIGDICMLGCEHADVKWTKDSAGLHICTAGVKTDLPVTLKMRII